jgi:hypothetical protein
MELPGWLGFHMGVLVPSCAGHFLTGDPGIDNGVSIAWLAKECKPPTARLYCNDTTLRPKARS